MTAAFASTSFNRAVGRFGAALLVAALLLPVGDAPWFSFWREWTAFVAVLMIVLAAITTLRDQSLPFAWPATGLSTVGIGLALVCWLQFAFGLVPYLSDALLVSVYLAAFAVCMAVAGTMPPPERDLLADRLSAALLIAAVVSVPLAVLQWTGWLRLDLDMRVAGGRPVAHMEQANLLCSLLLQGAFAAWRLAARGRLHIKVAMLLCVALGLAIVLTQSRVAWLAAIALLGAAAWRRDLIVWRRHGLLLLSAVLVLVVGTLLLPAVDGALGLQGATLSERVSEGRRPAAWLLFLDAAMSRPWAGWGVLQNGVAQFAVADRHPSMGYVFSSAHNVVLDLVIWFGIPLGLLAGGALVTAVLLRIARAASVAALASALAAAALVLHAMVELPLHYAYFLLPLGLLLGATSPRDQPTSDSLVELPVASKPIVPVALLASASLLALLASEYIRLTDIRPANWVNRETRHLVLSADQPAPDVLLLDQLRAYHAFAALQIAPGTSPADLDAARVAMQRNPQSSALERYARLAGVNGRDADAQEALRRVCKFGTSAMCERSEYAWQVWRHQSPELPPWPAQPASP